MREGELSAKLAEGLAAGERAGREAATAAVREVESAAEGERLRGELEQVRMALEEKARECANRGSELEEAARSRRQALAEVEEARAELGRIRSEQAVSAVAAEARQAGLVAELAEARGRAEQMTAAFVTVEGERATLAKQLDVLKVASGDAQAPPFATGRAQSPSADVRAAEPRPSPKKKKRR
jgi:predicted  nucleic acid-binding Zn-ribbon protein